MSSRLPDLTTRLLLLRLGTVLIFIILIAQLAVLQFSEGSRYQQRAVFNRTRIVRNEGARGVIYDRDGRILARNKAVFGVALVPADLPDDPDFAVSRAKRLELYKDLLAVINQALAEYTPPPEAPPEGPPSFYEVGQSRPPQPSILSLEEIETLVDQRELGSAYQPVLVAQNLPREVAMRVEEERYRLPGVELSIKTQREYFSGSDISHIVGYMGPIPEETNTTYREKGYPADAWVGWAGLEFTFERVLRGIPGVKVIEVDVNGRERAVIGKATPPQPGKNLILTLDLELQKAMRKALENGINPLRSHSAAAVALDPRTGYILGMVSLPTYDNNIFADGITTDEYSEISEAAGFPLLNHAISGIYPPGSTFKLVTAAAALEEGVISPRTILNAPGIIYLPNRNFPDNPNLAQPFVCWIYKSGGQHGDINVTYALAESCDIFFYKVGGGWPVADFEGLGVETLAYYANLFGYGELTGIDLPAENPGLVPNTRWKRLAKGERWVTGDTYNMAIGQGDVLATPLQVTQMTAAVANNGFLYKPQLVAAITDSKSRLVEKKEPQLVRELPIDPKWFDVVREGMWLAVNWEGGTAPDVALPDVDVAGKTGTAEFFDPEIIRDRRGNLPTHAWFTAFAPYEDPEIVVTVFVYNGGEGSIVAAPIAREILQAYFDIKARDAAENSHPLLENPAPQEKRQ